MINLTYTLACDLCFAKVIIPYVLPTGFGLTAPIVPLPTIPSGWNYFNGQLVCPVHDTTGWIVSAVSSYIPGKR